VKIQEINRPQVKDGYGTKSDKEMQSATTELANSFQTLKTEALKLLAPILQSLTTQRVSDRET
jgi:hypothetical protein